MFINEYTKKYTNNHIIYKYIKSVIMDFKNNSNNLNNLKKMKVSGQIKVNDSKQIIEQLELEKEKTRQLELIREIKKLELKLKNNKKYKHKKKYVDLSSILDNSDNNSENEETINENYDTISIQSTKSITTIDYIDLLS
jgi:hypothetical protein